MTLVQFRKNWILESYPKKKQRQCIIESFNHWYSRVLLFDIGGWNWERKQGEVWTWQENWTDQGTHCPRAGFHVFATKWFWNWLLIDSYNVGWSCALLISCVPSQLWLHPPYSLWRQWSHGCPCYYAGLLIGILKKKKKKISFFYHVYLHVVCLEALYM